MMSIPKIVGMMSSGFLLCLGLSGHAASATDATKAGQSTDRIGGQAGLKDDQEKLEGLADQSSADRTGGQAGLKGDQEKLEGLADQSSADRTGGQAGLKGDQEKLEGLADQSSGDRTSGQAGEERSKQSGARH